MERSNMTRKEFLRGAAVTAAAPAFLKSQAPSDEIRIGNIGTGVRGGSLVRNVVKSTGAKVVAICDVYKPHVEKGVEYALNPQAARYVDYRDLLADENVDAVVIATPITSLCHSASATWPGRCGWISSK